MYLQNHQPSSYFFHRWFICADFNFQCYVGPWSDFLPWSLLFILLYPVAIPIILFRMLFKYASSASRGRSLARYTLGILFDAYQNRFWWWEIVDMLHKLLIVAVFGLMAPEALVVAGLLASG